MLARIACGDEPRKGYSMLKWAIIFGFISLVTGWLGFSGVSGVAGKIAKVLFGIILIILIIIILMIVLAVGHAH